MCKKKLSNRNLLCVLIAVLLAGCSEPISQPKGMLAEKLNCPEGSNPEIERWGGVGENRWLQACKMKHGTFTGWHNETKIVEGEYRNGRKEGVWRVWSDDGRLQKEVTYENNKEVAVREFK